MLLVSEWSLKSPLHSATIASMLRALAGSVFHKFAFFMNSLTYSTKIIWNNILELGKRVLRTSEIGLKILRLSICKKNSKGTKHTHTHTHTHTH